MVHYLYEGCKMLFMYCRQQLVLCTFLSRSLARVLSNSLPINLHNGLLFAMYVCKCPGGVQSKLIGKLYSKRQDKKGTMYKGYPLA